MREPADAIVNATSFSKHTKIKASNLVFFPLIKYITTNSDYHNGYFSASKTKRPGLVVWNKT